MQGCATSLGRLPIADDEAPVRDVLGEYVAGRGYAVDTASDGEAALAAARRHRPDLVLLDVRMPGLGAFDYVAKPFAAADLDRAVSAAMLQRGGSVHDTAAEDPDDPWRRLARTVFRAELAAVETVPDDAHGPLRSSG